jgi:hypothetical protein
MAREPAGCGGFPRQVRRAVALGDSKVLQLTFTSSSLRIVLDAYVHVSQGKPGFDAGTGWSQQLQLVLGAAELLERPAALPLWLSAGAVDGDQGLLPVPLQRPGPVQLLLEGAEGRLQARGEGLAVEELSEPVFVERFAGLSGARPR